MGLLQYHTISNIDRPWDSGVTASTITFYRVSNVSEHSGTMPFGNSSFVLCTSHSSQNYGMQIAFTDNAECFAARALSIGTWTAWKKLGGVVDRVNASSSGSSVDISSYNSSGNYYTCPKDGVLSLNIGNGGKGTVYINGSETFGIDEATSQVFRMGMFVKQGMIVWLNGANYKTTLYFKPLSY